MSNVNSFITNAFEFERIDYSHVRFELTDLSLYVNGKPVVEMTNKNFKSMFKSVLDTACLSIRGKDKFGAEHKVFVFNFFGKFTNPSSFEDLKKNLNWFKEGSLCTFAELLYVENNLPESITITTNIVDDGFLLRSIAPIMEIINLLHSAYEDANVTPKGFSFKSKINGSCLCFAWFGFHCEIFECDTLEEARRKYEKLYIAEYNKKR